MAASATQCSHPNRTPSSGGEYCDTVTSTVRSEDSISTNIIVNKEETLF